MSIERDLSHIPEEVRKAYERETEQLPGESHQAWTARALHAFEDLLHRYPRPDPTAAPPEPVLPVPPADETAAAGSAAPETPTDPAATGDGSTGVAG